MIIYNRMNNFESNPQEKKEQPKEIERKFLIQSLPENLNSFPHKEINQGYIAITEAGTEVRLRKKGDKYYQTVKSGSGKIRTENEIEMTREQYNVLWSATEGKRLEKTRYEIPNEAGLIELDVYHGNLTGLITAEIEFTSEEASENFVSPSWFGADVTENKSYKNQKLALEGIPK
jgi:adenylate cyclase